MKIKQLIKNKGPISVAEFMTEALSDYYGKQEPFGTQGDFVTAPEISQIFGELLGVWCASMWQDIGSPQPFALVEIGPGRGILMQDLLRGTRHIPAFHNAMQVHMIETSERLQEIQQNNLRTEHTNIVWHKDLSALPDIPLIVVANELFDALPIHQYQRTENGWCERMVTIADDELQFTLSPIVPFASDIVNKHPDAPVGAIIEICQAGISLAKDIALRIRDNSGAAVFIDYGYDYYGYKDTLQAVKNHQYCSIFDNVGEADITAHVDFVALADVAAQAGAQVFATITQRDFLLSLGIDIRRDALLKNANDKQYKEIVSSVDRLVNPSEMGSLFKVLALTS